MNANPSVQYISGSGLPRLILRQANPVFESDGDSGEVYTSTTATAAISRALALDGSTEFASITTPTGMDSNDNFTVLAWVKTTGTSDRIIQRYAGSGAYWYVGIDSDGSLIAAAHDGTDTVTAADGDAINDGEWHLVVVVFDRSGDITRYVDGEEYGSQADLSDIDDISLTGVALYVGQSGASGNYFEGSIGELQVVYDAALTASDAAQAYTSGIPSSWPAGDIVAHYKWRGATNGEVLTDYSPETNNLTGTNVTTADVEVSHYPTTDMLSLFARVNMLISSNVDTGPGYPTYAKVTAIDTATNTLTVDGWTNGTPTNGEALLLNGWVADLPRTQETTEEFSPDVLIHRLYRSKRQSKHYGWLYRCILDYSRYISADTLLLLRPILAASPTDEMILIPRRDQPTFQFPVYFAEPIALSLFGRSPGYRKPVLVLDGKYPLASWPMISGYGMNYATNYGTSL